MMKSFKLVRILLSDIDRSKVQPDGRDTQTQKLREAVEKTGVIVPPVVCTKRPNQHGPSYEALDGHCRYAVAMALGLSHLDCLVVQTNSQSEREALFQALNAYNKTLQGTARAQSWALGETAESRKGQLEAMQTAQRKQIEDLVEILGEEEVQKHALARRALASAASCAHRVQRWGKNWNLQVPEITTIAEWIIEHRMSRLIDSISRNAKKSDVVKVLECIEKNMKCKLKR